MPIPIPAGFPQEKCETRIPIPMQICSPKHIENVEN